MPSTSWPYAITGASLKPLNWVRSPTTALKSNSSPGSTT
jgi:hypothetical protein